jgi:hypothetical protein
MGWYHPDGRLPSEGTNSIVRKMPGGVTNVPKTVWGCSCCKVWLCKDCFRMEDDEGNGHPERWDHDNQCLLAQSVIGN